MFVTVFLGILDLKSGRLQYCNGGHNAPILISPEGKTSQMKTGTNIPLGLFEGFSYEEAETDLPAGSAIFLYTDGVTEAENTSKELYSEERLMKVIEDVRTKNNPETVVNTVIDDVKAHAGAAEQSDDITMLYVYYNPE